MVTVRLNISLHLTTSVIVPLSNGPLYDFGYINDKPITLLHMPPPLHRLHFWAAGAPSALLLASTVSTSLAGAPHHQYIIHTETSSFFRHFYSFRRYLIYYSNIVFTPVTLVLQSHTLRHHSTASYNGHCFIISLHTASRHHTIV